VPEHLQNQKNTRMKLTESLESGPHALLLKFCGEWEGRSRVWFEPGDPVDDSVIRGTIKPLFDGRFVMHEYTGSFQGKPIEGLTIYGHYLKTGKFQSLWLDTFHVGTTMMLSDGVGGDRVNVLGHYGGEEDPSQAWGWRSEIIQENSDQLTLLAFNITPDGEETPAMQIDYTRVSK
jgi:hypothetical protein